MNKLHNISCQHFMMAILIFFYNDMFQRCDYTLIASVMTSIYTLLQMALNGFIFVTNARIDSKLIFLPIFELLPFLFDKSNPLLEWDHTCLPKGLMHRMPFQFVPIRHTILLKRLMHKSSLQQSLHSLPLLGQMAIPDQ